MPGGTAFWNKRACCQSDNAPGMIRTLWRTVILRGKGVGWRYFAVTCPVCEYAISFSTLCITQGFTVEREHSEATDSEFILVGIE